MSKSAAHDFLQRLLTDQAFLENVSATPEGRERRSLYRAEGFRFSEKELQEAKDEIRAITIEDLVGRQRGAKYATARTAVAVGADVVARALYWDTTG